MIESCPFRKYQPIAAAAGKLKIQIQLMCSNNMFSHYALQLFQARDLIMLGQISSTPFFHALQKLQVVSLGTYYPWSY